MYYFLLILEIVFLLIGYLYVPYLTFNGKKKLYYSSLLIIILLLAFRTEKLPDYQVYKNLFENIIIGKNYGFSLINRHEFFGVEYGFIYFVMFMKCIFGDFKLYLLFVEVLFLPATINSFYRIAKECKFIDGNEKTKYELKMTMLAIYFSYYALMYDAIAMRAMISISICVIALSFFIEKKYYRTFFLLLLGILIQRMTIIGVLIILVYKFFPKIRRKNLYVIIFVSLIALALGILGMGQTEIYMKYTTKFIFWITDYINYRSYISLINQEFLLGLRKTFSIIIALFVVVFSGKEERELPFLNELLFGVLLVFVLLNIGSAYRIYDYFLVYYVLLLANIRIRIRKPYIDIGMILIMLGNYMISFRVWELF